MEIGWQPRFIRGFLPDGGLCIWFTVYTFILANTFDTYRGFIGAKMITAARKQHSISAVLYISLSRDSLSQFGFLDPVYIEWGTPV